MILNRLQCSREAILQSGSQLFASSLSAAPPCSPLAWYLFEYEKACLLFLAEGAQGWDPLSAHPLTPIPPFLHHHLMPLNPSSPFTSTIRPSMHRSPYLSFFRRPGLFVPHSLRFRELEPQTSGQRPLQTSPLCMCMSVSVFEGMYAYPINYFPFLAEINNPVSRVNVLARGVARVCSFSSQKISAEIKRLWSVNAPFRSWFCFSSAVLFASSIPFNPSEERPWPQMIIPPVRLRFATPKVFSWVITWQFVSRQRDQDRLLPTVGSG